MVDNCDDLEELRCNRNNLTKLDVSNNRKLKDINFSSNQLEEFDVSNCSNLKILNCGLNQLTSFKLGKKGNLKELEEFWCNDNLLDDKSLNLSALNPELIHLSIKNNKFTSSSYSRQSIKDVFNKVESEKLLVENDDEKVLKVRVQTWLDRNYPKEQRQTIEKLDFNLGILRKKKLLLENDVLFDSLNLEGFYDLKTFSCTNNCLKKLTISNSRKLISLDCYNNAELEELICVNSQLTNLNLKDCNKLTILRLDNNQLVDVGFIFNDNKESEEVIDPKKITELYITNNKFLPQDLSLSKFTSLKKLDISGNKFYGSLEYLKDMNDLKVLDIKGTSIDRG